MKNNKLYFIIRKKIKKFQETQKKIYMKTVIITILSIIRIGLLTHLRFTKEELSGLIPTPHINANKGNFGEITLMPGDLYVLNI
jgi:hypothetical protein